MALQIVIDSEKGVYVENVRRSRNERTNKGKSIIEIPENYIVLDLETTGFDPDFSEIIEVGALKVSNGKVIDEFSSLVKPEEEIDEFITKLTGITNAMVADAPAYDVVLKDLYDFIGNDLIVGFNTSFDINFIYDFGENINLIFNNDYVDVMRFARKLLPELPHHRLKDMPKALDFEITESHRALSDCYTTLFSFLKLRERIEDFESFKSSFKKRSIDLKEIKSDVKDFDETHPLFNKHCAFTGTLEKMVRADAVQALVNVGGIFDNSITKKTNYLIIGNTDFRKVKDGKSSKQKKAEELKLKGNDIEVISENVFYDLILE